MVKFLITYFIIFFFLYPVYSANGGTEISSQIPAGEYTIGGKDVLKLIVYDEPDLSNEGVRVAEDGMISLPLIGDVKVSGLTTYQAERNIEGLLKDGYLKNPHVSISVIEYRSKKVFVLGAVKTPGSYELRGNATILEMISRGGGVSEGAGKSLMILRSPKKGSGAGPETINLNLNKLLKDGDLSLNLEVRDMDTIYIPTADSVFVFGEVVKPGSYKITDKDITLVEAITMAGGFTKIASPTGVKIIRVEGGVEKNIEVNLKEIIKYGDKGKDVILKPNDVIVVPERFF